MTDIEKRPGANWHVYYVDVADGTRDVMTVFGAASIEEVVKEAADDLNTGYEGVEANWFEIVGIVRDGVELVNFASPDPK